MSPDLLGGLIAAGVAVATCVVKIILDERQYWGQHRHSDIADQYACGCAHPRGYEKISLTPASDKLAQYYKPAASGSQETLRRSPQAGSNPLAGTKSKVPTRFYCAIYNEQVWCGESQRWIPLASHYAASKAGHTEFYGYSGAERESHGSASKRKASEGVCVPPFGQEASCRLQRVLGDYSAQPTRQENRGSENCTIQGPTCSCSRTSGRSAQVPHRPGPSCNLHLAQQRKQAQTPGTHTPEPQARLLQEDSRREEYQEVVLRDPGSVLGAGIKEAWNHVVDEGKRMMDREYQEYASGQISYETRRRNELAIKHWMDRQYTRLRGLEVGD